MEVKEREFRVGRGREIPSITIRFRVSSATSDLSGRKKRPAVCHGLCFLTQTSSVCRRLKFCAQFNPVTHPCSSSFFYYLQRFNARCCRSFVFTSRLSRVFYWISFCFLHRFVLSSLFLFFFFSFFTGQELSSFLLFKKRKRKELSSFTLKWTFFL
jgi:hypothetical protein